MTRLEHFTQMQIDGELYIDARGVSLMYKGVVPDESIREFGKKWGRKKVGNRWYYRKDSIKLPNFPLAKWQRMALYYMSLVINDGEAVIPEDIQEIIDADNYYLAKVFLKGAECEKFASGTFPGPDGKLTLEFLLLSTGHYGDFHLIVSDGQKMAGRALSPEDVENIQSKVDGSSTVVWGVTKGLQEIANAMIGGAP